MSEFGEREPEQVASPGSNSTDSDTSVKTSVEEFLVNANTLMARVKELMQQGNIRQIVIKTESNRPLIKIPLTVGVAGGTLGFLLSPLLLTSLAAIGILAGRLTLVVEKKLD